MVAVSDKAAIASHSTATDIGTWDAGANRRRLPNSQVALVAAHAWREPGGDPDAKATFKFIHHFVSSNGSVGAASTRASSATIAILNGGRGGTNIPDTDRQGVWNHAARHLRDADMEPPALRSAMPEATDLATLEQECREAELAEVQAFHAGTAEAPVLYRAIAPSPPEAKAAHEDGLMQFIASDESTDRMGDIIRAAGWKLTDFRKNPVFLWAHSSGIPAIGAVRRIAVVDKALEADVEFAPTPFAEEIKALYEGGFMRAVSVGFRALDVDIMTDESGGFQGFEFKKQELLEVSAVPVPANARALRKAYKNNFVMSMSDLTEIFRQAHKAATEPDDETAGTQGSFEFKQSNGTNADIDRETDDEPLPEDERLEQIEARLDELEDAAADEAFEHPRAGTEDEASEEAEEIPDDLADAIAELAGVTAGKE